MAAVDASGMNISVHTALLPTKAAGIIAVTTGRTTYVHIIISYRRGSNVARSTTMGNARASMRGTSDKQGTRAFFVCRGKNIYREHCVKIQPWVLGDKVYKRNS